MTSDGRDIPPAPGAEPALDDKAWQLFVGATTAEEFCRAWLAILCRQLESVTAGVVLIEGNEANTFLPIAAWPKPATEMSRLGTIAERALSEGRGVVDQETSSIGVPARIAYPIQTSQRVIGAVALEVLPQGDVKPILRQLHWGIAWLRDLFLRRELQNTEIKTARIGSVMETLATSLRPGKLQEILFELANHIARQLQCARVGIGLAEGHRVRVAALSDAAWFERNAAVVKRYNAAMDEAFDRRATVTCSAPTKGDAAGPDTAFTAHELLARETAAAVVLTVPLLVGVNCIGAITLERSQGGDFAAEDIRWIEAVASLLPSVIEQKRRAERGYIARLKDDARALLERLFGPRHLVWKFSAATLLFTVALLSLIEIDYRVTAKTVIEGEIQRAAVAPFEGFIGASYVRAGDIVREGQLLCELDNRDLKIEQSRWQSEREQSDKKLREAMAERNFAAVQLNSAQLRQAEAQLALATERIRRSRITAPFDGVVVSGDLGQLIGSPVEQGKKLFEIAPLSSYRVILQVDEREIRNVDVGQGGRLVISGIAGDPTAFDVIKVTAVATAEDGRNFFRVEARLHEAPLRLRPGMEGVGKIAVGDRRLWWILTHSFTDWLRLKLWYWMP